MKKLLPLLCLLLLLAGCSDTATYEIVATTAPVQQFAQAVCEGIGLEVGLVVSDSVSCLHDYTLSVRQMVAVEKSDVVILSGLGLEEFMADVLTDKDVIECAKNAKLLTTCHEHDHDHDEDHHEEWDPHIWLDPGNAAAMTFTIAEELALRYPEHADRFAENAKTYCGELAALREECIAELDGLPFRGLITFHDGFAYFANAFNLEILEAIEEESGAEASAKELKAMTELLNDTGTPAVFVETNGSRSAAEILARETGCTVGTLDTIMSGADYFDAIRANVRAVKEAMTP